MAIPFSDELLNLDYLIYSSHKTATQSLVATMYRNGFKCKHCHYVQNIGIDSGDFKDYVEQYHVKNKKKLNIISVFREPIERHISSFFQGYGTKPIRLKEVADETETIIYNSSTVQLQKKFISELNDNSLIGVRESLYDLSDELKLDITMLRYDDIKNVGLYETEHCLIHLFRFDILVNNMEMLLSEVSGSSIKKYDENISNSKWYAHFYSDFKSSLVIPRTTIANIYHSKQDLIKLFYAGGFEESLDRAIFKYG